MNGSKNVVSLVVVGIIGLIVGFYVGSGSLGVSLQTSLAKGKPVRGGTGTGTMSVVMVTDKNQDGLPNFGDIITFKVSTTATTSPWVKLECFQNGISVSRESDGIFPASLDQEF